MIHSVRFTVILDTNVVYPVIIRDILFWFAHYVLYTPKWSEHIFDEWKKVMLEKGISKRHRELSPCLFVELSNSNECGALLKFNPNLSDQLLTSTYDGRIYSLFYLFGDWLVLFD